MNTTNTQQQQSHYTRILSSLFCSFAIITLSFLCLLNNFSIDIYSAFILLKVVMPAAVVFWFIGLTMGRIFDEGGLEKEETEDKEHKPYVLTKDEAAYEIPSMFNTDTGAEDEFGAL